MPHSQKFPTRILQSIANITGQRDRDLLAHTLVKTLIEFLHCNRIAMYRVVPDEQDPQVILVAEGFSHPERVSNYPDTHISLSNREDFHAVFTQAKEVVRPLSQNIYLSVYPILGQHGVVGILETISDIHDKMGESLILAFLKVYSNYITVLDESETDTLTGLLNRRTFDNNIEKIIAEHAAADVEHFGLERRSEVTDHPHWLAIIDIDFFKRINDKFGHLYGDEVLLLLSRNMQRIFRQKDKLFRFGGEEFVVVLDRTSEQNAKAVLNRFRTEIEDFHFPQVGRVTISVGFVRLDKADVSSAIIGRADQALYYAKQNGRNRVCFYEDLIESGALTEERFSDDLQMF